MKTEFDLFLFELLGAAMSINETPNDYGLLDVLASLCKSSRTGRLQIGVGSSRGAFFFKDGQLVDARVGTLTGFAAVNLAVSSAATVLNFDSSIDPPAPRFTESNERILLKTRFGIDAAEAQVQSGRPRGAEGMLALAARASAAPPSLETRARAEVLVTTATVTPLNGAEVVPSYSSTQLKKATAPLKGPTTPLTPLPTATALLKDTTVPEQGTSVTLKVTGAPQNLTTAARRNTVVPLRIASSPPEPVIPALRETVVSLNGVGAPPQFATASLRNVPAPLNDMSVQLRNERGVLRRLDESATRALTSLLSPQSLSRLKTHAKTNVWAVQKKLASLSQALQALGKQSVSYLSNKKTAVRAASIALIFILAAVGFASYWSKGKETVPLAVPQTPATSSLRIPAVAPSTTTSDDQIIATKPDANMPSSVRVRPDGPPRSEAFKPKRPATGTPVDTTKTSSSETVAEGTSETKKSGAAELKPNDAPEEKQLAKLSSRGIAVEVRVEGGRVSEAFIKNRRAGLEGYEAAALRLARQRRYPKETTTTETLVFQVKGEH